MVYGLKPRRWSCRDKGGLLQWPGNDFRWESLRWKFSNIATLLYCYLVVALNANAILKSSSTCKTTKEMLIHLFRHEMLRHKTQINPRFVYGKDRYSYCVFLFLNLTQCPFPDTSFWSHSQFSAPDAQSEAPTKGVFLVKTTNTTLSFERVYSVNT